MYVILFFYPKMMNKKIQINVFNVEKTPQIEILQALYKSYYNYDLRRFLQTGI